MFDVFFIFPSLKLNFAEKSRNRKARRMSEIPIFSTKFVQVQEVFWQGFVIPSEGGLEKSIKRRGSTKKYCNIMCQKFHIYKKTSPRVGRGVGGEESS